MAAGQVNNLRRRQFHKNSDREYAHYRNDSCAVEYSRGRDHGATHKSGYRYSSRECDSRPRRDRFGSKTKQRNVDESCAGNKVMDYKDGVQMPPEKKRKFYPILWDTEEMSVRISSKNRVVAVAPLSPSHHSPPSSDGLALDVDVLKCDVRGNEILALDNPPDMPIVSDGFDGIAEFSSQSDLPLLPSEQIGDNDFGQGHVEEGVFSEARNIAMSRWASDSDSPRDFYDEELPDMRRSSPESGEIQIEDSGDGLTGSSGSIGKGRSAVHVSGGTFVESEFLDVNSMNIDEKRDTDSGDDGDSQWSKEPNVQRNINMLQACRSVFEFEKLNKINEGTYGVVYKAKDMKTGEIVALKKVKMGVGKEDGFPLSSLREINILLSFNHPSVVDVKGVVTDELDNVFMVMEYMEYDLKGLLEGMNQPFSISEVKCLMLQLLEGVKYLHDNWVLHRDLKTSNLLVSKDGELKICDFGLSRQYGSPLKPYTPVVVTLWYRAPELLLGTEQYSTAIDMWSVGCIMAELVAKEPLFKGKHELEQLGKIFQILGAPNEKIWPGLPKLPGVRPNIKQQCNLLRKKFPTQTFTGSPVLSDLGFDLLSKLLTYDPEKRITAEAALKHEWFREFPLPRSDLKHNFPVWHGQDR